MDSPIASLSICFVTVSKRDSICGRRRGCLFLSSGYVRLYRNVRTTVERLLRQPTVRRVAEGEHARIHYDQHEQANAEVYATDDGINRPDRETRQVHDNVHLFEEFGIIHLEDGENRARKPVIPYTRIEIVIGIEAPSANDSDHALASG